MLQYFFNDVYHFFSLVAVLHALTVFTVCTCIRVVTVVALAGLQFWDRPGHFMARGPNLAFWLFLSSPHEVTHILECKCKVFTPCMQFNWVAPYFQKEAFIVYVRMHMHVYMQANTQHF